MNCDDIYFFTCAFTAILQCGREALISANTTSEFISEITGPETGFLSGDQRCGADTIPVIIDAYYSINTRPVSDTWFEFPLIDADTARITLFTSGSTGKPKAFSKRLTELEVETRELSRQWGGLLEGRKMYSTVNHQHIYGLLFMVFLPVSSGLPFCADQIRFPESLGNLSDAEPILVCSPAFFKRVSAIEFNADVFSEGTVIFSSGGVLSEKVAREIEARLGTSPLEIYGSTETGGIAYRKSVAQTAWTPFPRNAVTINEENRIVVKSPYILEPSGFTCSDLGHFVDDGRFILEGRMDSIVKIEEKRISLTEVEFRLIESVLIKDSCVIALTGKRQYLAAAIQLSDEGLEFFKDSDKREVNVYFREHLAKYLENTVIPKKWRLVDKIPRNTQDKVKRTEIEALFRKNEDLNIYSVSIENSSAVIDFTLGIGSVYFNGHFREFSILPGVVQCDLAMRFAHEHLSSTLKMKSISRMKFKKPILPETRLLLELNFNSKRNKLSYSYCGYGNGIQYSSGTITLEEE
ncbi:MAG: acyl-CoA synthetase [Spirochaetales bacterium]|nr:acyl-CoA synthetase [Spirochaetales bacterium]